MAAEEGLRRSFRVSIGHETAETGDVRQTGTGPEDRDLERHRIARARGMVSLLMVVPVDNQPRECSAG